MKLGRFHFLRTFRRLTGVTPHASLLRTGLRGATERLTIGTRRAADIALDCGLGDDSNFNHAFRTEFGCNSLVFRKFMVHGKTRTEETEFLTGFAGNNLIRVAREFLDVQPKRLFLHPRYLDTENNAVYTTEFLDGSWGPSGEGISWTRSAWTITKSGYWHAATNS